jgi:hypothetical protein
MDLDGTVRLNFGDAMIVGDDDDETTFVVGGRTFGVRVVRDRVPQSVRVTVTMDGRFEWTFGEPGWRPLSLGAGLDIPYLWSARELIVLPRSVGDDPEIVKVDEDLLLVFHVDRGWLLVCETSVRRVVRGNETARLEFGDVLEHAAWDREVLVVRDASGTERRICVHGDELIA